MRFSYFSNTNHLSQMASLFKIDKSPFWYLSYKENGAWKKSSTELRHDDPNETEQARALRAEWEVKEHRSLAAATGPGWDWVGGYFDTLAVRPRSLEKYRTNWRWLALWLTTTGLNVAQVEYIHVEQYIEWRMAQKKQSGKRAGRNTAIQEVKLLGFVLHEGVRRNMIKANPLASLRLRQTAPKRKPEMTDDEIATCLAELEKPGTPEWMRVSFSIALATGCRLRETRIALREVEFEGGTPIMTFREPKGGEVVAFSIPVPSSLVPMLRAMKAEGRELTIREFPLQPSRAWQQFFQRVGLPHLCFHCLRVTKVTRLRREGVPREVAMRLVNHSSELAHLIYDRHQVRDLIVYRDAGGYSPAAKAHSPTNGPSSLRRPTGIRPSPKSSGRSSSRPAPAS